MMTVGDIAKITYELSRVREDRLQMLWEDERGHLVWEMYRLQDRHAKDVKTQDFIKKEFDALKKMVSERRGNDSSKGPIDASHVPQEGKSDKQCEVKSSDQSTKKRKYNDTGVYRRVSDGRGTAVQREGATRSTPYNGPQDRTAISCQDINTRSRNVREGIPGHDCTECSAFYNEMLRQGLISQNDKEQKLKDILQRCSRHKSRHTPPLTPDGFWDLSI
mmetsp:Transcript_3769/g.5851  ORF Transcript_3769/g.5851 Transcript_3769/m.5851 type:complete len:219 (-) Transcript_3769:268-924(-)